MNRAPKEQAGLALGAWGAVQATAAGLAVAAGGLLRDIVGALAVRGWFGDTFAGPATGYAFVYALELVLLAVTVVVMSRLVGRTQRLVVPAAGGATAPAHSNP
jgi:MFS transporter, BCD family, chlorophyll transporter